MTNAQKLAIFRACVLQLGNPEHIDRSRWTKEADMARFRRIVSVGAPVYWQATVAFGGAVFAVRVSVLWNQYRDWYKNDFAAGRG